MMVLAASAAAQASPCDDFKAVLAARIESTGVRGYSLEVVPASDPVPSDAKVIATCESGTRKFLYRRWGAARAASAAQPPTAADAPVRRALTTREERARAAPPAATPAAVAQPVPRPSEAAPAPAASAAPAIEPAASGGVAAVAATERTLVAPPAPVTAATPAVASATLTQRVSGFVAAQWRWLGALALVVLLGGLWMWRVGAYDKDGLPRGPRL